MLNWSNYDALLLDMDGTLLDLNFDNVFWQTEIPKAYANHHQLDLDAANAFLQPKFEECKGTLAWYSTDYWSELVGFDVMNIKRQHVSLIAIHPFIEMFLLQVRASTSLRIIIATNADPHVLALKMERTGLARYMDALVSSHDLGHAKEEQPFWQQLMAQQNLVAERCIFIDDSASVLQSAELFGIGQLVGILAPDSQRPSNPRHMFSDSTLAVENFQPLLASLNAVKEVIK